MTKFGNRLTMNCMLLVDSLLSRFADGWLLFGVSKRVRKLLYLRHPSSGRVWNTSNYRTKDGLSSVHRVMAGISDTLSTNYTPVLKIQRAELDLL